MRKRSSKRRPIRSRTPEGQLQDAIRDLFRLKYKWRAWRTNVHGPARTIMGGGLVKCSEPGHADITALVPHTEQTFYVLHVEVKSKTGRQSYEQKIWQQCVEANGEYYILARSQDEVEGFVREKGWAK